MISIGTIMTSRIATKMTFLSLKSYIAKPYPTKADRNSDKIVARIVMTILFLNQVKYVSADSVNRDL